MTHCSTIKLVVGLGNPGTQYEHTRHNAGVWFVQSLASQYHATFKAEKKFHGLISKINLDNHLIWLLIPDTYMNKSGDAVAGLAFFYKIDISEILIAHDELDLPVGVSRFKSDGGHGGHNGLRDIISKLGNQKHFHRLRIGIDRAPPGQDVANYVLTKPPIPDRQKIDEAIQSAVAVVPKFIHANHRQEAVKLLHTARS